MKKIILLLIILLAACKTNPLYAPAKIEYHTGTTGLEITTIKNMPPETVFESGEFTVAIELKNKGASDITDGIISIAGLDPKYTTMNKEQELFEIAGKSPAYPEGGYDIQHFKLKNILFPDGKETHRTPFTIVAHYDYQTQATIEVCINADIYSYVKTEGCEVKNIAVSGGQGAPVAVTLVEPSISLISDDLSQVDAAFGIHLENKGKGTVTEMPTVESALLGNKIIECSNIRKESPKEDNKWYVLCSTKMTNLGEAYNSPLQITVSYQYRVRETKQVAVKSLTE